MRHPSRDAVPSWRLGIVHSWLLYPLWRHGGVAGEGSHLLWPRHKNIGHMTKSARPEAKGLGGFENREGWLVKKSG